MIDYFYTLASALMESRKEVVESHEGCGRSAGKTVEKPFMERDDGKM